MSYDWTSTSYQERKVGYQAYLIYALSIALVYLVLAALYESWTSPAAVIFVVPIALVGVLLALMPSFQAGDPADHQTAVGPLVTLKQYERVQSYIRIGIEEGAEVLVGGEGHPRGLEAGYFVKPTVFVNVKNDMTIAREEIFGPVLCVITYETEEDAIRIANDTTFGLHAFVSGANLPRARRVASQILAGRVAINGMDDEELAALYEYPTHLPGSQTTATN